MRQLVVAVALLGNIAILTAAPKVEIRTQRDKSFSFKGLRTWTWHPDGAGQVKLMSTPNDDSAKAHAALDPVVVDEVTKALTARGLTQQTQGASDLIVNYYLLVTPGMTGTDMTHYLPSVAEYGLPPIPSQTNFLRAFERGSLVLDLSAPSTKSVVWRGIAQTEVDRQIAQAQREARIRKAVQDIVKKLPDN
jgi:hypothetical protein